MATFSANDLSRAVADLGPARVVVGSVDPRIGHALMSWLPASAQWGEPASEQARAEAVLLGATHVLGRGNGEPVELMIRTSRDGGRHGGHVIVGMRRPCCRPPLILLSVLVHDRNGEQVVGSAVIGPRGPWPIAPLVGHGAACEA